MVITVQMFSNVYHIFMYFFIDLVNKPVFFSDFSVINQTFFNYQRKLSQFGPYAFFQSYKTVLKGKNDRKFSSYFRKVT